MDNEADVIVFANNKEQKQEINIGKANNQNFVSIAFCSFESILVHRSKVRYPCGCPRGKLYLKGKRP